MVSAPPEQRQRWPRLLQGALQVAVHLDVAAAQVGTQLVQPLDQPGPVAASERLYAQGRHGCPPVVALVPAAGGADLLGEGLSSEGGGVGLVQPPIPKASVVSLHQLKGAHFRFVPESFRQEVKDVKTLVDFYLY